MKILCISLGPTNSCAYAPGYIQTFISWTLFYLSNRKPLKNLTFISCSVLTDFCQYLRLPLYHFFFEFFWSRNFWGSCYSSICFICDGFRLKPEAKRVFICYTYTNVANRFVFSFVWRKFSSVGIGEWWDELKMDKSSSLVMPMSPQEISKNYKRRSLGMPPRHPFFIGKNQVTFQNTIFLLLHALCIFLGASVAFDFSFPLLCLLQ
jgi:hypothetical protein